MISLRSLGDPEGFFLDARGIVLQEDEAWVLEAQTPRLQIFKEGAFHYALPLPEIQGARPMAFALAPGGRPVVAWGGDRGAVLLLGPDGRVNGCLAAAGEEVAAWPTPLESCVYPVLMIVTPGWCCSITTAAACRCSIWKAVAMEPLWVAVWAAAKWAVAEGLQTELLRTWLESPAT